MALHDQEPLLMMVFGYYWKLFDLMMMNEISSN